MEMNYCTQCGGKLEARFHEGEGRLIPWCDSCGAWRYPVYNTAVRHPGVLGTHGVYFDDEKKLLTFDVLVDFTVRDKGALCRELQVELAEQFPGYTIDINCDTNYTD